MGRSRRLADQERRQIVLERTRGVAVRDLAIALKVSSKTVYNVPKGERLPCRRTSHAEIRDLAVLVFDMAGQIQEMFRARRCTPEIEVIRTLAGLVRQGAEQGAK